MPKKIAVVEHAGTGLRMPESTARQIDELSKTLPRDFTYRRIAKSVSDVRVEAGERTDVSTISTDDVDREGEVILPSGGDWTDYNKVVPWEHNYDELPVGSCWWIKSSGDALIAKTHYAPKPPDWGDAAWMPSAILHLMQQPVPTCTGKSVGVIPLHQRKATADEIARNPRMKNATVVDRWKGLEYSCCAIPVNPAAEMQIVSKCEQSGLISPEFAKLVRKSIQQLAYKKPLKNTNTDQKMSKYAHIDFKATKEVQKAHKEGLQRHEAGESRGLASPETLAMAKHLAEGGEASPEYVRKAADYSDQNPHHATAKPGTPAYCLALMVHGGRDGATHYKALRKAMDDADAEPGTMVDENSAPPEVTEAITKSAGANENNAGDGGAAVPVQEPADVVVPCPDCKSEDFVDARGIDPVKGKMYECGMCGKSFSEKETTISDNDGDEPNGTPPGKTKSVKSKSEGAVTVNHDTVARAASLIDHGHYTDDAWEAPNGGDRKPEDCIGKREGENVEPAERCVCPVIKNGQVYVHAVADAESRESGTPVGEAAAALMRKIQAHRESSAKTKAFTLTPEQIRKAVERELKDREPDLLKKALEIAQDKIILAMGGV